MRSIRQVIIWGLLVVFLYTSGCASIVSKSSYPITINSNPDQASITITDEDGEDVYTGETPTTVTLNTKAGYFQGKIYTVTFTKEGYEEQMLKIKSTIDGWYVGNCLFGGLFGLLVVDPLTGAMWRLDPDTMTANLVEKTSSLDTTEMTFQFVLLEDVPEGNRSNMIRIK